MAESYGLSRYNRGPYDLSRNLIEEMTSQGKLESLGARAVKMDMETVTFEHRAFPRDIFCFLKQSDGRIRHYNTLTV